MLITKIEQQKKDNTRYSVFIDGKFNFGIAGEDLLYLKLKEGMNLTENQYNKIMENVLLAEAKDRAFRYLGYKPRTEYELRQKLNTYDYPENIIEDTIEILLRYGYIDDSIYAKKYIEERIRFRADGKKKIKFDLAKRGIQSDLFEKVFMDCEYNPEEMIDKLLENRLKIDYDEKERQRTFNYLSRKGFEYYDIQDGFHRFESNER